MKSIPIRKSCRYTEIVVGFYILTFPDTYLLHSAVYNSMIHPPLYNKSNVYPTSAKQWKNIKKKFDIINSDP